MKNIYVLPTDKPSRLHFDSELFITPKIQLSKDINSIVEGMNIYITSDEEIKDEDFAYDSTSKTIVKVDFIKDRGDKVLIAGVHSINLDDNYTDLLSNFKKIILTTDQDLIKDGVQAIDDEFLEWFVKNPSCEEVEVDYRYDTNLQPILDSFRNKVLRIKIPTESSNLSQIIIPKEETNDSIEIDYSKVIKVQPRMVRESFPKEEPKQETLGEEQSDILEAGQILVNEETLEYGLLQHIKTCLQCNNESQAIRLLEKYGFEKQEERYSVEEVELITNEMVNWAIDNIGNPNPQSGKKFDEVIAKFKTNKT